MPTHSNTNSDSETNPNTNPIMPATTTTPTTEETPANTEESRLQITAEVEENQLTFAQRVIATFGPCDEDEDEDEDEYGCYKCDDEEYEEERTRVQSYHEHGLSDYVQVFDRPDPKYKGTHRQNYTIGFEVEKNGSTSYADAEDLFAYWEYDGSCGIEGITHAYSLASTRLFTRHVKASTMIHKHGADERCGGHTSVRGRHMNRDRVRPYIGLLYAMHRKRLTNYYCREDKRLQGGYDRYSTVNVRNNDFLEFRFVSAVKNAQQLLNRFDAFGHLVDAVEEQPSFSTYVNSNMKLLKKIYPNETKRDKILSMAHDFQSWVNGGAASRDIAPFA
jgi:hypothetical protein